MDDRMDAYRSMLQPSAGNDDNLSDYENSCSPAFANVAEPVRQVMEQTGIRDPVLAGEALEENARCVEAAVDFILHLGSLGIDQKSEFLLFCFSFFFCDM